jgi:hypothetical protein
MIGMEKELSSKSSMEVVIEADDTERLFAISTLLFLLFFPILNSPSSILLLVSTGNRLTLNRVRLCWRPTLRSN